MGIIVLSVRSVVDPRTLAVNRRYRNSQALPADVQRAMLTLQGEVYDALAGQSPALRQRLLQTIEQNGTYEFSMDFYFPRMRSDADGPVKHTIDAVEAGINQWLALRHSRAMKFNDSKICVLVVHKHIGEPGLSVNLYGSGDPTC